MSFIYKLISQEFDKCWQFSQDVDVDHYSDRDNQQDEDVKREQQFSCKAGELGIYHYLVSSPNRHTNVSYPDFGIYSVGKKNWNHDITTARNNIHVKSQLEDTPPAYKNSWSCETKDKHLFESYRAQDAMAFTTVDYQSCDDVIIELRAIIPVVLLHKYDLFKPPVKPFAKKKVIYLKDLLITFPNKLIWM